MAGLLGDVLPWAFSQGDRAKRYLGGLLADPIGSMQQTAGLLQDYRREDQQLNARAFADQSQPFRVTDKRAMTQLADRAMAGPMGFAPAGITAWHGSPHVFEKFDSEKIGSTTDDGRLGRAFYLSTDKAVPAAYANAYKVDADIKSPLKISMPDFRTDKRGLVTGALGLPKNASASDITRAAKARGFDSVILDYSPSGYAQQEIAVFAGGEDMLSILERNGQPLK